MQEKNGSRKSFLDRMTDGAIRRYSRRGLLGKLGKQGLILASATGIAGVALGVDTPLVGAATTLHITTHTSVPSNQVFEADPDTNCIRVPPPCEGSCVFCKGDTSTCTTGGARCTIVVGGCNCCFEYGSRAYGSYDCYGHFHCTTQQC